MSQLEDSRLEAASLQQAAQEAQLEAANLVREIINSGHSHSGVLSSQLDNASRGMNGSFLHVAIASPKAARRNKSDQP